MDNDMIARRAEGLSPEARALFWEVQRRAEETGFEIPPDELVIDLHQRLANLPPLDRQEFVDLFRAIALQVHEEKLRLEAEVAQTEGFIGIIARAQELDRRAGRPVNKAMTLGEAIVKLEAAADEDE